MALDGENVRAFDEFHRLAKAYQPHEAGERLGYIVVPADQTLEEFLAEGEKANEEARARREAKFRD